MFSSSLTGTVLAANFFMVIIGVAHYLLYYGVWNSSNPELTNSLIIWSTFLGSLIFCLFAQCMGRKTSIATMAAIFAGRFIISEIFYSELSTYCLAVLEGFSYGGIKAVLPIYIGEISEIKYRGRLISTTTVSYWIGYISSFFITALPYSTSALNISGAILSIIFAIVFAWKNLESPYYYLSKNQNDLAKKALDKLRTQPANAEIEFTEMLESYENKWNVDTNEGIMTYTNIPGWAKSLIMVLPIQFSASLLVPGIRAVRVKLDYHGEILNNHLLFFGITLASSSLGPIFIDIIGRKALFMVSFGGVALYMTIFEILGKMFVNNDSPILFFLLTLSEKCIAMGLIQMRSILIVELFSPRIKVLASGVITSISMLMTSLLIDPSYQEYFSLYVIIVHCLIMVVFVRFCLLETTGKSFFQIQSILNKKNVDPA